MNTLVESWIKKKSGAKVLVDKINEKETNEMKSGMGLNYEEFQRIEEERENEYSRKRWVDINISERKQRKGEND